MRTRRILALVLATIAATAIAATTVGNLVAGALNNDGPPWRFVAFIPFEPPLRSAAVIASSLLLLAGATRLGIKRPHVRQPLVALALVATPFVLVPCALVQVAHSRRSNPRHEALSVEPVAASPDGRFVLIAERTDRNTLLYRVRSTGWPSRESKLDLACTATQPTRPAPDQSTIPSVLVRWARFVNGTQVQLGMSDGHTWLIRFNPQTLRPNHPLSWCYSPADEPK
jgi:hypothetical protein